MQLADISPVALPRCEDVEGADRLPRALWDSAIERASEELARRARPALVMYTILLAAAGVTTYRMSGRLDSILHPTVLAVIGIALASLWRQYLIARPAATSQWWARFGVLTLANALLLGALGAVVTLETGIGIPAMIYWFILAAATAGATASLIPSAALARTFAGLALLPLVLVALLSPERGSNVLALILVAYLVFMVVQIRSAGRTYWSAVVAEMLLQVQADSLNRARLQAQSAMQAQELVLEELTAHREAAEQDYAVAARVFQNILARCCLGLRSINACLAPLERFNGDVVMATTVSGPRLRVLLGDFTGHGLAAAVGAIPVSEVFFATARRNLPVDVVAREMNNKLKKNLPPGLFFAAFLADIDPAKGTLTYWSGGIPPAFVLDSPRPDPAPSWSRPIRRWASCLKICSNRPSSASICSGASACSSAPMAWWRPPTPMASCTEPPASKRRWPSTERPRFRRPRSRAAWRPIGAAAPLATTSPFSRSGRRKPCWRTCGRPSRPRPEAALRPTPGGLKCTPNKPDEIGGGVPRPGRLAAMTRGFAPALAMRMTCRVF